MNLKDRHKSIPDVCEMPDRYRYKTCSPNTDFVVGWSESTYQLIKLEFFIVFDAKTP